MNCAATASFLVFLDNRFFYVLQTYYRFNESSLTPLLEETRFEVFVLQAKFLNFDEGCSVGYLNPGMSKNLDKVILREDIHFVIVPVV
jgi:hypothetical protein